MADNTTLPGTGEVYAAEDRSGVKYQIVKLDAQSVISTNNVRAAASMAAGATYQGTGEDVSKYGRVGVSITSSNASRGTLTMEVSHDGITYGGPPRTWTDTRFAEPHMWNIVEQYFRIKYVNGTVAAENLSIQVQYSNNADTTLGHELSGTLLDETEAMVTRALLVGKNSKGEYKNVGIDLNGLLKVESTDKFTHLLFELLSETKKTNAYLRIISGDELIDDIEDF